MDIAVNISPAAPLKSPQERLTALCMQQDRGTWFLGYMGFAVGVIASLGVMWLRQVSADRLDFRRNWLFLLKRIQEIDIKETHLMAYKSSQRELEAALDSLKLFYMK